MHAVSSGRPMAVAQGITDQPLPQCTEEAPSQTALQLQLSTSCSTSTKVTNSHSTPRPASNQSHQFLPLLQGSPRPHPQVKVPSKMEKTHLMR